LVGVLVGSQRCDGWLLGNCTPIDQILFPLLEMNLKLNVQHQCFVMFCIG